MTWTAILPVKGRGDRKTRLAGRLSVAERDALVETMLNRAVEALLASRMVRAIFVLAPAPMIDRRLQWIADAGRGLNAELAAADAALGARPLLVLLPDLPFIEGDDVRALLDEGSRSGLALAPDRHGRGTNAVAIGNDRRCAFHFGEDSQRAFVQNNDLPNRSIIRHGLACDLDTEEDLDLCALTS